MSNTILLKRRSGKENRVQARFDLPVDVKERLQSVAAETGFSMAMIVTMLVRHHLSKMDVLYDMNRMLLEAGPKNRKQKTLTARQKREIENGKKQPFTDELI